MSAGKRPVPWHASDHQDVFFYLLIAIFFVELIIGGIAFFYGIIHAAPEVPGGPPLARFPWLAWMIGAITGPVALLLIVHLAGSLTARTLIEEKTGENQAEVNQTRQDSELSPGMRRFYASVRHAPAVVVLAALLFCGAALFFIDGALAMLGNMGSALIPYIPWIAGSLAALLAICFLAHAILVYRQRKMENEYAWRREVLEKTGVVVVDKASAAIPTGAMPDSLAIAEKSAILDITPKSIAASSKKETMEKASNPLPPPSEGTVE